MAGCRAILSAAARYRPRRGTKPRQVVFLPHPLSPRANSTLFTLHLFFSWFIPAKIAKVAKVSELSDFGNWRKICHVLNLFKPSLVANFSVCLPGPLFPLFYLGQPTKGLKRELKVRKFNFSNKIFILMEKCQACVYDHARSCQKKEVMQTRVQTGVQCSTTET